MTIYIEDFILQNTIINLCLLRLVQLTTKTQTNLFKLTIASLIGAGFSVLTASAVNNITLLNLIKIFCAVLMLKIAFKSKFKQFVFNFALLFAYTYALCGIITSLSNNCYLTNVGFVVSYKINLWWVMFLCLMSTYLFEFVAKHIKLKMQINNLVYKITLFSQNNRLNINAYLDTGNMLNVNGQPVLILDITSYLKLTKQNYIDFYLKQAPTQNLKLSTVAGYSNLKLVTLDNMEIKINGKIKKYQKPLVAINSTDKFSKTNYQALISPAFL